mmetsp:Transcript_77573/g.179858  ORF Transcript_77573/g.179858 Transcript_77573/m.179858 type:complete len:329 (+) Transcript_77573:81-1067(+)
MRGMSIRLAGSAVPALAASCSLLLARQLGANGFSGQAHLRLRTAPAELAVHRLQFGKAPKSWLKRGPGPTAEKGSFGSKEVRTLTRKIGRHKPPPEEQELHNAASREPGSPVAVVRRVLDLKGADIQYFPGVFNLSESTELFGELQGLPCWQRHRILLRDRESGVPKDVLEGRPTATFSSPAFLRYSYSGSERLGLPFPAVVSRVKSRVEEVLLQCVEGRAASAGRLTFNFCVANRYDTGLQGIDFHADDEREILRQSPIATASFGVTREFSLESKRDRSRRLQLQLEAGSVMVMAGRTQENFLHSVVKDKSVRDPRISLTFRIHKWL